MRILRIIPAPFDGLNRGCMRVVAFLSVFCGFLVWTKIFPHSGILNKARAVVPERISRADQFAYFTMSKSRARVWPSAIAICLSQKQEWRPREKRGRQKGKAWG